MSGDLICLNFEILMFNRRMGTLHSFIEDISLKGIFVYTNIPTKLTYLRYKFINRYTVIKIMPVYH